MSLIHEALQKAESDRRAGEVPPLLSIQGQPRRNTSRASSLPWVGLAIIVMMALGYANRTLILPSRSGGGAPEGRSAIDAGIDADDESSPAMPGAAPLAPARKPDTAARPSSATPKPNGIDAFGAAQADAIASQLGAGRGIAEEVSVPEVPQAKEPVVPVVPMPVVPKPEKTVVHGPAVEETQAAPDPVITTPAPATPAPSKDAHETPWIYELPLDIRQSLPPLKVTMQVFHQDPLQRFAIIDGKRVSQGAALDSQLTLIEIQRDGMVFDVRGKRFLLPRMGR